MLGSAAVAAALLLMVAVPGVYFALRYQHEKGVLQVEGEIGVQSLLELTVSKSGGRRLDEALARAFLSRAPWPADVRERHAVLASGGRVLAESVEGGAIESPVVGVSIPLHDSRGLVGEYRIERSARAALLDASVVAAMTGVGSVLGLLLFRAFPLRKVRRIEDELRFRAEHDPLTGLLNRSAFLARLDEALARAGRSGTSLAVMFVDLDDFRAINDTVGHPAGDIVLRDVADRLRGAARPGDAVARIGGDEFALIFEGVAHVEDAAAFADDLLARVKRPFTVAGVRYDLTCCVGISMHPADGGELPEQVLAFANIAMRECKGRGRSDFEFYSKGMQALIEAKLQRHIDVRRAWEERRFVLYYQPICDAGITRLAGAEALIRWNSEELGIVTPQGFVAALEEIGLIDEVGDWVIREACRQAREWFDRGLPEFVLSVNVSPRQFRSGEALVESVRGALLESGLPASRLLVEITEGMMMEQGHEILLTISRLKALGVSIAVDDFGTGYSSLAYLKHFPVDVLKIDRCFVSELSEDSGDSNIVLAIVQLARGLRLSVTAEGVETEQQLALLQRYGCDTVQGYALGMPAPAAKFEADVLGNPAWLGRTLRFSVGDGRLEFAGDAGHRQLPPATAAA